MASSLPHLPDIEQLSPRVIRVLGGNPSKYTLQGTNTYLIGTGSIRLLLDTGQGFPIWTSSLQHTLADQRCTVSHVLLTHWHTDHTLGIDPLLSICPEAKIHKHHLTPDEDNLSINDGEVFQVEGATLRAIHTPGHAKDHMCFWLEEEAAMFSGDNVLGHGTSVFEDLGTYMQSLEKMRTFFPSSSLPPLPPTSSNPEALDQTSPTQKQEGEKKAKGRIYPAHGALLPHGLATITEYISHRQSRQTQILEAISSLSPVGRDPKLVSVQQIVKIVYKDTPENLHEAAAKGVVQILEKLKGEGKVVDVVDGEGGRRWGLVQDDGWDKGDKAKM